MRHKRLRVGLCYNLDRDYPIRANQPADITIEWCDSVYIDLLKEGISTAGFSVVDIGDPINLLQADVRSKIDIIFSIAEMIGYRYREILVPSLCEFFGLPYLFARPDAMLITADKNLSNLLVERMNIPVPAWACVKTSTLNSHDFNSFPYIVKPNAEGSSMGISKNSVAWDALNLKKQTEATINGYRQPAIIQQFIEGMEVTVGVIQVNGKTTALTPLVVFDESCDSTAVFSRELKNEFKKNNLYKTVGPSVLDSDISILAERIFDEIGCLDAARIDFRITNGRLFFIEINGLTDFHPKGAFCKSAEFAGFTYPDLLTTVITNAWKRNYSE